MLRISLRRIDALLNGELDPEEAARLRESIAASPEAKDYLERQQGLHSDLGWERLRLAVERERRKPFAWGPVSGFFLRAIPRGKVGRIAWATAGFAMLILAVALGRMGGTRDRWAGDRGDENRLAAKGSRTAEARLQIHGRDFSPGSRIQAGPGDTLGFSYRCADTVNAQVWYRDDDGDILPFAGRERNGFVWPPVTAWTLAPQLIRLEGGWRRQDVWLILSRKPLDPGRTLEAIRAGRDADGVRVLAFRMAQDG